MILKASGGTLGPFYFCRRSKLTHTFVRATITRMVQPKLKQNPPSKRMPCKHSGCERDNHTYQFHDRLQLCKSHYAQHRRYGKTQDLYGTRWFDAVCSVPQCGKDVAAMGYCRSHYQISKNRPALPGERMCSVKGCGKKHDARGFCGPHYNTFRAAQKAGEYGKCEFQGCGMATFCKGFCRSHYLALDAYVKASLLNLDGLVDRIQIKKD